MATPLVRFTPLVLVAAILVPGCTGQVGEGGELEAAARAHRLADYQDKLRHQVDTSQEGVERARGLPPTPPEDLILIIEDKNAPTGTRAHAVRDLGSQAGTRYLARLMALLPGKADKFSMNLLELVGEIGDPQVLPALRKMRGVYDAQGTWATWRIEDALERTIRRLEKAQQAQDAR